jgi:hypothetical protein
MIVFGNHNKGGFKEIFTKTTQKAYGVKEKTMKVAGVRYFSLL